jgi:hypothetical protein
LTILRLSSGAVKGNLGRLLTDARAIALPHASASQRDLPPEARKFVKVSLWSKCPSLLGKFPVFERDKDTAQNGKVGRFGGT